MPSLPGVQQPVNTKEKIKICLIAKLVNVSWEESQVNKILSTQHGVLFLFSEPCTSSVMLHACNMQVACSCNSSSRKNGDRSLDLAGQLV